MIDVRRMRDLDSDPLMITEALGRNPEMADRWRENVAKSGEVIIFCDEGGSVRKSFSQRVIEKSFSVRYIEWRLAAWKRSGGRIIQKLGQMPLNLYWGKRNISASL